MQLPLQITARDMSLTGAIEGAIRTKVAKLESFYDRIMSCRVLVESPHRHHHKGSRFNVRVQLSVPGGELVVKHAPHEDLYVAIRDAFDAARRQLQEYSRRRRGDTKHHEDAPQGRISELDRDSGYGYITTPDGREVYFHRNSVVNQGFADLQVGMAVRYAEERGEKGPQASSFSVL